MSLVVLIRDQKGSSMTLGMPYDTDIASVCWMLGNAEGGTDENQNSIAFRHVNIP